MRSPRSSFSSTVHLATYSTRKPWKKAEPESAKSRQWPCLAAPGDPYGTSLFISRSRLTM